MKVPSLLLVGPAGLVATVLATALLQLAPAAGLPLVDIPTAVGALWSSDAATAFRTGYIVFFLGGAVLFPVALKGAWKLLPGPRATLVGALVKGLVLALAAWVLSGLLLGVLGAAGRPVAGFTAPGWFAAGLGGAGAVLLLAGHLVYGAALGVVAGMGLGLSPVNALGWVGHGAGREA